MSVKVRKVIEKLESLAPEYLAQEWDNVGLQIGSANNDVSKILIALDATEKVIKEAMQIGANMLIVHHPMIFNPITKIISDDSLGKRIDTLIKNNINLYVMHTNFDAAFGGTNDILSSILGLDNIQDLVPNNDSMGIGRIGDIKPTTIEQFAYVLKKNLSLSHVRIVGNPNQIVKKVAVCTGSGMGYLKYAIGLADVFITGDVKFHEAQEALQNHIGVIDIGHYGSENITMPSIKEYMKEFIIKNKIEIMVSEINEDPFYIIK